MGDKACGTVHIPKHQKRAEWLRVEGSTQSNSFTPNSESCFTQQTHINTERKTTGQCITGTGTCL